ncbi:MAG TPA: hypothetical protein VF384_00405 [Planctomycetota bacterium]
MRLLFCSACLASVSVAQVAPGEAIQSFFSNVAPIEGLAIVNRSGTSVPVTGLTAQGIQNINSVALDPIDNSIWIGSITQAPTTHGLRRATLTGTALGPAALVATLPTAPGGSFSGIAFDQNGNPIVSGGAVPPGTGGVFRVIRATGAVTNLLSPHPALPAGTANCVSVDQATGDIYFGVTSAGGAIYRLPGPFPNTAPPVLLGTTVTNQTISGVSFWPAHGVNPARVYWTNFAAANSCVGYVPAAGGAAVTTSGTPTAWPAGMNWINYDRRQDDFWLCTAGIDPDQVYTMTDTGANTLVVGFGAQGSPSAIDANDAPAGSLRVVPQYLPATPTLTTIEVSMSWNPGDIGIFGIFAGPTLITTFGLGIFNGSGTLSTSFPAVLGAGSPGQFTFLGASLGASGLQITAPLSWPAN